MNIGWDKTGLIIKQDVSGRHDRRSGVAITVEFIPLFFAHNSFISLENISLSHCLLVFTVRCIVVTETNNIVTQRK